MKSLYSLHKKSEEGRVEETKEGNKKAERDQAIKSMWSSGLIGAVTSVFRKEGGLIDFAKDKPPRIGDAGLYALHDKEMVLSAQDTLNFAKNIYAGGFGTGAGGGNITIVNAPSQPVTNLAQSSTNINEIHVPESAINYERTFRTMAHGQMAHS